MISSPAAPAQLSQKPIYACTLAEGEKVWSREDVQFSTGEKKHKERFRGFEQPIYTI